MLEAFVVISSDLQTVNMPLFFHGISLVHYFVRSALQGCVECAIVSKAFAAQSGLLCSQSNLTIPLCIQSFPPLLAVFV